MLAQHLCNIAAHRPALLLSLAAHCPDWIAHAQVKNPVEYKKYTDRLPALFGKFGAKILARGGDYKILEGDVPFERHVVIEFPVLL